MMKKKITCYDPAKNKEVVCGFVEHKVFHRDIKPEHYFKKYKGYGEQVSVLEKLSRLGVYSIVLHEPKRVYLSDLKQWFDPSMSTQVNYGHGLQSVLPIKHMLEGDE